MSYRHYLRSQREGTALLQAIGLINGLLGLVIIVFAVTGVIGLLSDPDDDLPAVFTLPLIGIVFCLGMAKLASAWSLLSLKRGGLDAALISALLYSLIFLVSFPPFALFEICTLIFVFHYLRRLPRAQTQAPRTDPNSW